METIAIIYATTEGQTHKIADHVREHLAGRGFDIDEFDVRELPGDFELERYAGVVVGASVHGGKHQPQIVRFVEEHREALKRMPSAFFSVSLSAAGPGEEGRRKAEGVIDAFIEHTGWHPVLVASVAGALQYSKYGFLERMLMRAIAKRAGGDIDTTHDYEYTDWASVDAFAEAFEEYLRAAGSGRAGEASAPA